MAEQEKLIIDNETAANWRLFTDDVMGGVSKGQLSRVSIGDQQCLKMTGDISLENNGGFIQAAIEVPDKIRSRINEYEGITLQVTGNNQQYNIHLRTSELRLPWQSYRYTFVAKSEWQTLNIPFEQFAPYRTEVNLDITRLNRIGVVAIGREVSADLCFTKLGLY